jgi:hypothetical protein
MSRGYGWRGACSAADVTVGGVGPVGCFGSLELGDFCNSKFTNSVIRPKRKMPVSQGDMLDLAPGTFPRRVVPKLAGMIGEPKCQIHNYLLLCFRQADESR